MLIKIIMKRYQKHGFIFQQQQEVTKSPRHMKISFFDSKDHHYDGIIPTSTTEGSFIKLNIICILNNYCGESDLSKTSKSKKSNKQFEQILREIPYNYNVRFYFQLSEIGIYNAKLFIFNSQIYTMPNLFPNLRYI